MLDKNNNTDVSAKYFQALVENLTDIILVIDADAIIKYASPSYHRLIGFSAEETIGKSALSFVHSEDLQRTRGEYVQLLKNPEMLQEVTLRLIHKDGSVRYVNGKRKNLLDDPEVEGIILNVADITDKIAAEQLAKEHEEALQISEEKFRNVFENSIVGKSLTQIDGALDVNNALCKMLGYSKKELSVLKWQEITHPDDIQKTQKEIDSLISGEKSDVRFEKRFIHKNGNIIWAEINSSIHRDYNDNPLYLMSTILDITERKLSQLELTNSLLEANRFRESLDLVSSHIYMKDCQSRYIYANKSTLKLFGVTEKNVIGSDDSNFFPPATVKQLREIDLRVLQGAKTSEEIEVINSDGSKIVYFEQKSPIYSDSEQTTVWGLMGISTDITEHKQLEKELKESEEKFRNLFNNSEVGMFRTRIDGSEVLDFNEKYLTISNYTREEVVGKQSKIIWADVTERDKMVKILDVEGHVSEFEFDLLTKQGKVKRCVTSLRLYRDTGILEGSIYDITDRMHAEQELKNSEEQLRKLVETQNLINQELDSKNVELKKARLATLNIVEDISIEMLERKRAEEELKRFFNLVPDMVCIASSDGKFELLNNAWESVLGYNIDEMLLKPFTEFIHPDDIGPTIREVEKQISGKATINFANRYRAKNGDYRLFDWVASPSPDGNKLYAAARDITESKLAEEKLRISEKEYRNLFELANDSIIIFEPENETILDANSKACKTYGFPKQEFIGMSLKKISQDVEQGEKRIKEMIEENEFENFETVHYRKDGTKFNTLISASLIEYKGRKAIQSINLDISERIETEKRLKESESRYKMLANNSSDVIWTMNLTGKYTYISPSVELLRGYSVEEIMRQSFEEIISPGSRKLFSEKMEILVFAALMGKTVSPETIEIEQPCIDDHTVWTEVVLQTLCEESGKPVGIIGVSRDITERKIVQDALSESELKFRTLITQMQLGLAVHEIICDENRKPIDYRFLDTNKSFEKITGLDRDGIIGKTVLELLPGTETEWIERYGRVALTGEPVAFENYARELDRYYGVVAYSTRPKEFAVIIEDITERKKVSDALSKSEEKLRNLFNTMSEGIALNEIVYDAKREMIDYRILEVNNAFYSIAAYLPGEVIGNVATKLYGISYESIKSFWETHKNKKETEQIEMVSPINNKVFLISTSPFINDRFVTSFMDITERKRAEIEIREKEVQYRNLANSGTALIWTTGDDKLCNYFNEPWLEFTGRTLEQELGYGWAEGVHPEDLEECVKTYVTEFDKRNSFDMEYRLRHASGEYRWIEDMGKPNYNSSGEFVGYIGHCFDITERKRTEKALLENEEKFRKLTDTAIDAIISIDSKGNVISWNESAIRIFDYSYEEIKGKNVQIIIPSKHKASHKRGLTELYLGRDPKMLGKTIQIEAVKKNKTVFPIELSLSSWDSAGTVFYTAIIRDISERVRSENELLIYRNNLEDLVQSRTAELDKVNEFLRIEIEKEKEIELMLKNSLQKEIELNEIKSRFISTTSHEFRTPLTSVLSSTELIQRYYEKWSEEKLNVHFNRIKGSIQYLVGLLDDVLTISRAERGKITLNPEKVDLKKLAQEYIDDAGTLVKNHQIHFNYRTKTSEFYLDPKLLKFIISNLLSNAIKYSPNGGNIDLDFTTSKKNLIIEISDEGIGIPPSEIEFIFQSFYRTKNAEEIPGTGLGLSIVKLAVDLHGGEISVKSEIDKGSRFTIKIPK